MLAGVGQRSPTATFFALIAAFVEQRTWRQADLARRLQTRTETVRRQLHELQDAGFKLEREEDHPHVYWSVPKHWFPGMLAFQTNEIPDLLRLLGRAPRGKLRDRIERVVLERVGNIGNLAPMRDANAVRPPLIDSEEETRLSLLEDAANTKTVAVIRYFTASRRDEGRRAVSIHRVDLGPAAQLVATCHRSNTLKRFRVSNVSSVQLDDNDTFRHATEEDLARFDAESLGGFRVEGTAVHVEFVVRDPEASWVARNLPDARITASPEPSGGMRFAVDTAAVSQLARFVVSLGDAVHTETPALRDAVRALAEGALRGSQTINQR